MNFKTFLETQARPARSPGATRIKNCAVILQLALPSQLLELEDDRRFLDVKSQAIAISKGSLYRMYRYGSEEKTLEMYKRLQYILATHHIEPAKLHIA